MSDILLLFKNKFFIEFFVDEVNSFNISMFETSDLLVDKSSDLLVLCSIILSSPTTAKVFKLV